MDIKHYRLFDLKKEPTIEIYQVARSLIKIVIDYLYKITKVENFKQVENVINQHLRDLMVISDCPSTDVNNAVLPQILNISLKKSIKRYITNYNVKQFLNSHIDSIDLIELLKQIYFNLYDNIICLENQSQIYEDIICKQSFLKTIDNLISVIKPTPSKDKTFAVKFLSITIKNG